MAWLEAVGMALCLLGFAFLWWIAFVSINIKTIVKIIDDDIKDFRKLEKDFKELDFQFSLHKFDHYKHPSGKCLKK